MFLRVDLCLIFAVSDKLNLKEKKKLLIALRTHGSSNLELIQKELPDKSISDIRSIIEEYSKMGMKKFIESEVGKCEGPMKDWIHIINSLYVIQKGSIVDVIPRVLKYIALFENAETEEEINLRYIVER